MYYDTEHDRIQVQEVRVSGGHVVINSHVMNTGHGEIRVLGGYGNINIVNETPYDILVNRLDVSTRGDGTLEINDKTDDSTTVFQKENGVLTITETSATGHTVKHTESSATYKPTVGWRYGWSVATVTGIHKHAIQGTSSWLGIDAFARDPDDINWDYSEILVGPALVPGSDYYFLDTARADSAYTYGHISNTLSSHIYLKDHWTESSWYGKKTYYSHYVEEQRVEDIYTHTIKADYEISVNFIGGQTGNISVISMPAAMSFCMDRSPTRPGNAH